jgi:hypothetical protein
MEKRNYESEILDIIKTEDWNRAKQRNDKNLYHYVYCHKDTDKNCMIIWKHIRSRNYESEISNIIRMKNWDRAKCSNDGGNLYQYIKYHKDTDESCMIIWEHMKHVVTKNHCPYTTKDYLLDYFKHGKLENKSLHVIVAREIRKGNQSYIDIRNLIVAAENFQDPVALETLELIKNHLEKEGI